MTNPKDIESVIKNSLSEHLGVEPEDIDLSDSLTADLHMRATDISDFLEALEAKGIDTKDIDLTSIDTVAEIIEVLGDSHFE